MTPIIALLGFLGIWLCLWLPMAAMVVGFIPKARAYPVPPQYKLPLLLPLYGLAPLAVWGYSQYLASTSWSDYGLEWSRGFGPSLGLGFGVALFGVVLLVGVEVQLGWRSPHLTRLSLAKLPQDFLVAAGILVLTGFIGGIEELVFRGVLVQGLLAVMPIGAMVGLASLIFALSHLVWDGPEGMPSLPGLGLMGAVLLLARWVDGGSLALPWGLHTGWIFAIALLDTLQLAPPVDTNISWLAGKPDQPLTGLPALGLLALTGLGLGGYFQFL